MPKINHTQPLIVEYLKHMKNARPLAVKRQGAGYHDTDIHEEIASATAVRQMLNERKHISRAVPDISREILEQNRGGFTSSDLLTPLITQKVLQTSALPRGYVAILTGHPQTSH